MSEQPETFPCIFSSDLSSLFGLLSLLLSDLFLSKKKSQPECQRNSDGICKSRLAGTGDQKIHQRNQPGGQSALILFHRKNLFSQQKQHSQKGQKSEKPAFS